MIDANTTSGDTVSFDPTLEADLHRWGRVAATMQLTGINIRFRSDVGPLYCALPIPKGVEGGDCFIKAIHDRTGSGKVVAESAGFRFNGSEILVTVYLESKPVFAKFDIRRIGSNGSHHAGRGSS